MPKRLARNRNFTSKIDGTYMTADCGQRKAGRQFIFPGDARSHGVAAPPEPFTRGPSCAECELSSPTVGGVRRSVCSLDAKAG